MKKKNQDIAQHLSIAGSAVGGIIGVFIDPITGLVSTSILGSSGYIIGKKIQDIDFFNKISVEKILFEKMNYDFDYSVISEFSTFKRNTLKSRKRIEDVSKELGKSFNSLLSKNEKIIIPNPNSDFYEQGKILAQKIKKLRGNDPIKINCECVDPACVSVFKSIANRYGLNLEIDYVSTTGVYQMMKINEGEDVDFLTTTNAPFFLSGLKFSKVKDYRLMFEIHGEEQKIFRRKGANWNNSSKLYIFKNSSAEEQLITKEGLPNNIEIQKIDFYENLVSHSKQLNPGELIIAWEPIASYFEKLEWLESPEEKYINYISFFCHKRWNNKTLKPMKEMMKNLFILEWNYCKSERKKAYKLLIKDKEFIDRFSVGIGLKVPKI